MKRSIQVGAIAVIALAIGFLIWKWKQDEPRRISIEAIQRLDTALRSADSTSLLEAIVLPAALQSRTSAEQVEFVRKALVDELSPEGLAVLRKKGRFGPLKELFPQEAQAWATQAGMEPEDCVAFKLERNGQRCEVVLAKPSTLNTPPSAREGSYRIVRCNNVKQLAGNF